MRNQHAGSFRPATPGAAARIVTALTETPPVGWAVDLAYRPVEIADCGRLDLPAVCAALGYRTAVEVGVMRGEFSEQLALANPDMQVIAVDSWGSRVEYEDFPPAELDGFEADARARLAPYAHVEIRKTTSMVAAATFADRSLDFVYLDADHRFPAFVSDLAAWRPKVRPGGIVAGHDYRRVRQTPYHQTGCHVVEVLVGYTQAYGINPYFVLGDKVEVSRDWARSWCWMERPEWRAR